MTPYLGLPIQVSNMCVHWLDQVSNGATESRVGTVGLCDNAPESPFCPRQRCLRLGHPALQPYDGSISTPRHGTGIVRGSLTYLTYTLIPLAHPYTSATIHSRHIQTDEHNQGYIQLPTTCLIPLTVKLTYSILFQYY